MLTLTYKGMAMKNYQEFKKEALKNPEAKAEYERLRDEFELHAQRIAQRKSANFTQKERAQKNPR